MKYQRHLCRFLFLKPDVRLYTEAVLAEKMEITFLLRLIQFIFIFLRKYTINGMLTTPVSASAKGWDICIPVIPKRFVVTIKTGINISPDLSKDKKDDVAGFLIL